MSKSDVSPQTNGLHAGQGRQARGALTWLLPLLVVVAVLVIAAAALISAWRASVVAQGTGASSHLPWPVYFTDPRFPDRSVDHHGGLDEKLSALVDSAKASVDVAIYQLDLPGVTQSLLNAAKRGAAVRVVTDIDVLSDPNENPEFKRLQTAGIKVVGGNRNGIMHDKFVVVDGAVVWTGSWNFTTNDTYRNNNNAIVIRSQALAQNYTAAFEQMLVETRFGAAKQPGRTAGDLTINGIHVENYFAPEDRPADRIGARLKQARTSIYIMAYSFTDDALGDAVLDAARAGVAVHGIFETTGAKAYVGEWTKMSGMGLDVLLDGNPYLMHHKVFIIDQQTVVTGSFNFSENANHENDENVLIIDDPYVAQLYLAEFQKVYRQAQQVQPR